MNVLVTMVMDIYVNNQPNTYISEDTILVLLIILIKINIRLFINILFYWIYQGRVIFIKYISWYNFLGKKVIGKRPIFKKLTYLRIEYDNYFQ